ncbi:MAG TPA: hypothetical protein VES97_02505 [Solirubrobacteraceae bacterium]|nr:hypothetical protein [Solirubrobacteraceae bacterium]
MRKVEVTLAAGIALLVAVGALVLTRSPPRVVRVASPASAELVSTTGEATVCQENEVLPAHVSGIRLSLVVAYGSNVHVIAYSGRRVLTEGRRGPDWTSNSVTVPVKRVSHTTSHVTLCFAIGPNSEPVIIAGIYTPPRESAVLLGTATPTAQAAASGGRPLNGRVGVEYLAAGQGSWWSRALSVARHVGIGRAFSGTWIALLIAALMAAVGILAVRLAWRELP